MGRIPLIRTPHLPYHVYGRSNNREWFYLPIAQVWAIFAEYLTRATEELQLVAHAFVLMSNHYHLVASTPEANLDVVMARVLKRSSDEINRRAGRINHVFGGPYKWNVLDSAFKYHHLERYVYQNPLRQGLCRRVEDYPHSTLFDLSRGRPGVIPVASHTFGATGSILMRGEGHQDRLAWLNDPYDDEHRLAMQRALARRRFAFCKHRWTKKIPSRFRLSSGEESAK